MGALVVYDISKYETFVNAAKWLEEIRGCAEEDCVIFLVGNKVDLVDMNPGLRQVTSEMASQYAQEQGIFFEETSAVTNTRVGDVFEKLIHCNYSFLMQSSDQ